MSEEEKEAIANLKHIVKYWKPEDKEDELANIEYNSIKTAIKYIDKLEKEIEDTKQTNANLKKEIKLMKSVNINENFISKEIIREKIEELNKKIKGCRTGEELKAYYQEEILEELLKESDTNEN